MPYNPSNFDPNASGSTGIARGVYRTSETLVDVEAAGYFNKGWALFRGVAAVLVLASDDAREYRVTAVNGLVTLAPAGPSLLEGIEGATAREADFDMTSQGAAFTAASSVTVMLSTNVATDFWALPIMLYERAINRLHVFFRVATGDAAGQSVIRHMFTDDAGRTISAFDEGGNVVNGQAAVMAVPPFLTSPSLHDYRDLSGAMLPDGAGYLAFSDVPTNGVGATSWRIARTTDGFKTRPKSTDIIFTQPAITGRVRGRGKIVPGSGKSRLMQTGWVRKDQAIANVNECICLYSVDGGKTFVKGGSPFNGGPENEMEAAYLSNIGVAVARREGTGFALSVSENGGTSWTQVSDVAGSAAGDVAPSIDIVTDPEGTAWVIIGGVARTPDAMRWWCAPLVDVLASGGASFVNVFDTAADMRGLSGYHCPVEMPNGEWAVLEVKAENDETGRELRLRRMRPKKFLPFPRRWAPRLIGATSGEATYTKQEGTFTKIGGLVVATFKLQIATKGNIVGTPRITGLPFVVGGGIYDGTNNTFHGMRGGGAISNYANAALAAGETLAGFMPLEGQVSATIYKNGASSSPAITLAEIGATFSICGTVIYHAVPEW